MPLAALHISRVRDVRLRRVLTRAARYVEGKYPACTPAQYFLQILYLRLRVRFGCARDADVRVCRFWPSILFSGHRAVHLDAVDSATVDAFELYFTRELGRFIGEARPDATDAAILRDDCNSDSEWDPDEDSLRALEGLHSAVDSDTEHPTFAALRSS